MSDDAAYTLDTRGLDKLVKALKKEAPKGRVGILGDSAVRQTVNGQPALTNAQIGSFHEFGTGTAPRRSFLREPMISHFQKALDQSGAWSTEALKEVLATASFVPWVRKACIVAEGVVIGAFDSGGYGKWTPSQMGGKKVHQTLVETQQLRNSITSEVKDEGNG